MIYLYIYIYTYMYIYTMRTEMISRNCCSKTRYVFLEKSHFWVHGTMVFWKNTLRIPHFAPNKTRKTLIFGHICGKLPNYRQNPHFIPPQNRASRGLPSHGIHRLYICRAQRLLESQCIVYTFDSHESRGRGVLESPMPAAPQLSGVFYFDICRLANHVRVWCIYMRITQ